jgi:hypothetical protein
MASTGELQAIRDLARTFPGLRLLVLHGSRASGAANRTSDWDFAYLGEADLDEFDLRSRLGSAVRCDDIDLSDLSHSGGLLRYRAARSGILLYERTPGLFERFCCEAAAFWFDVEAIVRSEHEAILAALG